MESQSPSLCSGMLVLEPSETTYQGLVRYLAGMASVPKGDQQVVEEYFASEVGKPVQLLGVSTASFGQCIGRQAIPGGDLPSFIHKSDMANSCFKVAAQPELCRDSRLGQHWRRHFCEAAAEAGIGGSKVDKLCGPSSQAEWDEV